jgi:predicted glycosyltransferase
MSSAFGCDIRSPFRLVTGEPIMRRIALYSHDAQGLGHIRRNIAIARALGGAEPTSILVIAGAREAALFPLPAGTDTLALPALSKGLDGAYRSRSLHLDLDQIVRLRAHSLCAALAVFEPDVLIVDKLPGGVENELVHSFGLLEAMGTQLVLGLREVLDEPDRVRAEWERSAAMALVRRHYEQIWIYGDQQVFDPIAEYGIPADVARMVRFTGYLDRLAADRTAEHGNSRRRELELPDGHLSVCLVGGGEDGHRLADAFARCRLPEGSTGLVVTGPFMPEAEHAALTALAHERDDLRVLGFLPDADTLVWLADEVIAMGGYNTSCEILAGDKRALIVPRVTPRSEQLIRARRLSDLGAVDVLHPDALTPDALSRWLADGPARRDRHAQPVDMGGLQRLPVMLDDLLRAPSSRAAVLGDLRKANGRRRVPTMPVLLAASASP